MFSLSNKIALVTGAGSGIGESIARTFAAAGAFVYVVDCDVQKGASVAAAIVAAGGRAEFAALDVTTETDACALASRLPVLDVLVNNAGIGHVGNLLTTGSTDIDRLYTVNVRGVFNLCKAFVPAMLARRRGSVVNLASIGGLVALRDRLGYCTSKFAVVGLTKALALDHSHTGVRFNAICPCRVDTPFVQARIAAYSDPQEAYRQMASSQLNGRMARPDEIAAAAVYLAADESEMVTGSTFSIDGGLSAGK